VELRSLASGSSGNAYLVQHGETALLIDAGISGRRLDLMLRHEGIVPGLLNGILVTHEHADHIRGVAQIARKFGAPLYGSLGTLRAMGLSHQLDWRSISTGEPVAMGSLDVIPIGVPHDAAEPLVYRIQCAGAALAIATDFGSPTPELESAFRDLDLLVLEANHDEDWLWRGHYPWSLKKRVASERGHISNETAAEILIRLGIRAPSTVWLAHLSAQNNAPSHALSVVSSMIARAGMPLIDLHVAERDTPSLRWRSDAVTRQLVLGI
jgi:phosphoribosyl 1,2-cyclic phosphodiesterase